MENGKDYAPIPGKIPGTAMNLGGHELILAPLNLDGIQAVEPMLESYGQLKGAAAVLKAAAGIIHLSLSRNYQAMTVEQVLGLLDMGNVNKAVLAVCNVSGMEFTKPGENRPATQ